MSHHRVAIIAVLIAVCAASIGFYPLVGQQSEVPEQSEKAKKACQLLKAQMLKKAESGSGITVAEYQKLIELCPEEEGGWFMRENEEELRRFFPKVTDEAERITLGELSREAQEEARKRQELIDETNAAEDDRIKKSHSELPGGWHHPCECWDISADAYYHAKQAAPVAIHSRIPTRPTKLKWEIRGNTLGDTHAGISGRAARLPGPHTYEDGSNCCDREYRSRFVQVLVSRPMSSFAKKPTMEGQPLIPGKAYTAYEWNAIWCSMVSTPDYWETPPIIHGNVSRGEMLKLGPRDNAETCKSKLINRRGHGRVDLYVDGQLCEGKTLYFAIVD